jgi:hypothetical protein
MVESPVTIVAPSQDPMLIAVGRSIQAFVNVETGLAYVFASLVQPKDRATATVALNAVFSANTKINIVRSVVEYRLQGELRDRAQKVLDRCGKRVSMRNKVAHYMVGFWPGARTVEEAKKMQVALLPPVTSPKYGQQVWGDEMPIRLNKLEQFTQDCHLLFGELVMLSKEIDPGAESGSFR